MVSTKSVSKTPSLTFNKTFNKNNALNDIKSF